MSNDGGTQASNAEAELRRLPATLQPGPQHQRTAQAVSAYPALHGDGIDDFGQSTRVEEVETRRSLATFATRSSHDPSLELPLRGADPLNANRQAREQQEPDRDRQLPALP